MIDDERTGVTGDDIKTVVAGFGSKSGYSDARAECDDANSLASPEFYGGVARIFRSLPIKEGSEDDLLRLQNEILDTVNLGSEDITGEKYLRLSEMLGEQISRAFSEESLRIYAGDTRYHEIPWPFRVNTLSISTMSFRGCWIEGGCLMASFTVLVNMCLAPKGPDEAAILNLLVDGGEQDVEDVVKPWVSRYLPNSLNEACDAVWTELGYIPEQLISFGIANDDCDDVQFFRSVDMNTTTQLRQEDEAFREVLSTVGLIVR